MASNNFGNHSTGPQNVAAGRGPQLNNNGYGAQFNYSTVYGYPFQGSHIEAVSQRQQEKEACLRTLAFPGIHARQNDINPAHRSTCDWLFEAPEFHKWRDPASLPKHNGVLWIKGKPGAGKSTLMKHAYRRYKNDIFQDHLILSHFFNARGETLEKTPLGLLRSMVYQLIESDHGLYELFVPKLREKQRTSLDGHFQWQTSELKGFIRSITEQSQSRPLLLHIDALDECDESEVRDVVGFLESLSINALEDGFPLKICLSSRHYPSIRMRKVVELVVEKSKDHQTDIARYVRTNLRIYTDEIADEVVKKADNVFLWVEIVVSLLNKACDEGMLEAMRKTLDEIPVDLESIFSAILSTNATSMAETVLMLQWVLFCGRPLEPVELLSAVGEIGPLSIDVVERRITASSRGLIEVRKGEHDIVQFIHLSVSDFLLRQKRLQKLDPTLGADPVRASHGRLWARCWSYIEQTRSQLTTQKERSWPEKTDPFFAYASRGVFYHAEMVLSEEPVGRVRGGAQLPQNNSCMSLDTIEWLDPKCWIQKSNYWFPGWRRLLRMDAVEMYPLTNLQGDETVLYVCTAFGLPRLVNIISQSADLNETGGEYGTALQVAAYGGNEEMVQLLLRKGAEINARGGRFGNALQAACWVENREIVQLLLDQGADVNAKGGERDTALHAASEKGNKEIAQLLLDNGADVNVKGGVYGTALQAASLQNYKETVQLLLDYGADVNAKGGEYGTALQAASIGCDRRVVQLLLDRDADVNANGGFYGTALQAASAVGDGRVCQLLLKQGADVNAEGGRYGTALQAASAIGHYRIVQLLLDNGARWNSSNLED
ncbi:ankyrin repeat-containing domain protein [Microdochium trichocladiopsis]|uniref:Ankyrin repeat-containing domain protein n=1 Tax=Microdochium trichocladiopsis TaxID=1682393 RepID=A0A9P8Y8D5_9PEZI|nr:ankyrin repeat-containing domain protein [Microdochium trichocladiopsis]KAH7031568.1 ankyrin repeat-containing domain protein [Microdochium trichocladiopsis]